LSNLLNEYELIVDSAEQAIPRPGDYDEQKKFYSSAGKKKYHTWLRPQRSAIAKINLLCCLADIVDVVLGERGPKSDINIWRERKDIFHPEQNFAGDKAYIGEGQIKTPKAQKTRVNRGTKRRKSTIFLPKNFCGTRN